VSQIADLETIIVPNEARPAAREQPHQGASARFNIRLTDDKSYPGSR